MTIERRRELGERHPSVLLHDQALAWTLAHAVVGMMKEEVAIYNPSVNAALKAWFVAHE